ncbi:MAG: hypothetical protein KGD57_00965 [Candidatus Lokiarchaeota archaeon]|nr:hypothetical protein [Candidatus Lokiarchaeota archaeon]
MGFKDKLKAAAGDVAKSAKKAVEDVADSAKEAVEGAVNDVVGGAVNFISENLLDLDVLKGMTAIAADSGPAAVAHIALNLGSMNENFDLFLDTLCNECWRGGKRGESQWLERMVNSWWKTMNGRKYVFDPAESARIADRNTADKVKLFFKADDGASVKNKPITVIKEDGVWRVQSITP